MERDRGQLDNSLETLQPVWNDNYVAIAANSSNEYVPYLSVYLESLRANTDDNTNYDVVILEKSISDENKEILKESFEIKSNLSLRFYNPSKLFENKELIVSHPYLCQESYYRLSAPSIFQNYKKLIFTDVDLIFNEDPKELFNIDMKGAPILSVLEPVWSSWVNKNATVTGVNIIDYSQKILKLENLHQYFNTGVMLMDIGQLNSRDLTTQMINKLSGKTRYLYQDQDVINGLLASEMGILPFKWNYEIILQRVIDEAESSFTEYCNHDISPGIIHWIGSNKPWVQPTRTYAYKWWQYARRTPYYEVILQRMINSNNTQVRRLTNQVRETFNFRSNVLKYWRYKLMAKISFGKKKEHYNTKKQQWKEKIRSAKQLRGKN